MKRSIRVQIMNLFLLTLIFTIAVIVCVTTVQSRFSVRDAVLETAQSTLVNAEKRIVAAMDNYLSVMQETASDSAFTGTEIDTASANRLLKECAARNGYERVGYTDASGISNSGLDLSEQEYFIRCRDSLEPVVSEIYVSQDADGEMSFLFAAPIEKTDGSFGGIVYCAADASLLTDMVADIAIGDSSTIFVLDSEGTVIASPQYELVTSKCNFLNGNNTSEEFETEAMAAISEQMIQGSSGYATHSVGIKTLFSVYAPIELENGWSVCVCGDLDDFLVSYNKNLRTLLVVTLFLLVAAAVDSAFFSRKISKPVVASTKRMVLLAEGDLHTETLRLKRKDESKVLMDSIADTITILNTVIHEISASLSGMAKGDFTVQIQGDFKGDFLPVKTSLNQILAELREVLKEIKSASAQVHFGSKNVAELSESLASTVTEQTALMDGIRENVLTVSAHAGENAKSAHDATNMADAAIQSVTEGNASMHDLLDAMQQMEKSSQAIDQINKTVSDIAFQTNILALNASVEAARAGAAGKGFAVVAEEVKALAEKSALASENASALIEKTVESIQNGMEIARKTSSSMEDVVTRTQEVDAHIAQIAVMSQEQLENLEQITKSIQEFADALTSTAASSEESSATAEQLNAQADLLADLVARFKI